MNKYNFDFRRIEDILHDMLGITNPDNIMSLKQQIRESLGALSDAIDRKTSILSPNNTKNGEKQKTVLIKELDEIENETDLDKILRKCIIVKCITLLSLEVKVRPTDTYDEQRTKNNRRKELFAVSDLSKSVPSILDLMEKRRIELEYIDSDNRIIDFKRTEDNTSLDLSQSSEKDLLQRLDLNFSKKPSTTTGEYRKILEEAGIYVYRFGELTYSRFSPYEEDDIKEKYIKSLVGVIKKDEFGVLRKYAVLMNDIPGYMSPEFCRDVLFSDMLLRNAKNNMGFLGVPKRDYRDEKYGWRIGFDEIGLDEILSAIYFENDPSKVVVTSNFKRVNSVSDAFIVMEEKMEQAIQESFEHKNRNQSDRGIGDDD